MFTLKNVRYKNVLQITELTIDAQKITCILGESGSGKTTLLKLLNHLISYDQGVIEYKGQDLKTLDAVVLRREVVLLPQLPIIFPGTIKDNLLIGLLFAQKKPANNGRLLEELNKIGLNKKLEDDAHKLSGGEKQRLALARILLMNPEVMLLDEPTSALDDDTGEKMIEYVKNYAEIKQKTLVIVTHSKQTARSLGEKIITVNNGFIAAVEEVA